MIADTLDHWVLELMWTCSFWKDLSLASGELKSSFCHRLRFTPHHTQCNLSWGGCNLYVSWLEYNLPRCTFHSFCLRLNSQSSLFTRWPHLNFWRKSLHASFWALPFLITLCLFSARSIFKSSTRKARRLQNGLTGKSRPYQRYNLWCSLYSHPRMKTVKITFEHRGKCNRTRDPPNGKWEPTSLSQVPVSGWAQGLSCSLLFLIKKHIKTDSWVTCLIRISELPAHSFLITRPTAGIRQRERMFRCTLDWAELVRGSLCLSEAVVRQK